MITFDDNLISEIFIGLFVAVILAFVMGAEFYNWISEELISYAASVFFVMPMAVGAVNREFPKEYLLLTVVGGIILVAYAFFFQKTAMDIVINILQTIVVITVLSAFFSVAQRLLARRIPPPFGGK